MTNIKEILKSDRGIEPELKQKYWDGKWNRCVRYYFYITKGLALFNEFRYIVMSVAIVYAFLKLDNFWYFPIMFFSCIPPLCFAGHISIHYMDKITEFLQIRYATHYSHYNISLQESQKESQEKILEELIKLNERLGNGNISNYHS